MKQIIKLCMTLLLLSLSACANDTHQKNPKGDRAMTHLTDAYNKKPAYRLEIEGSATPIEIFVNGSDMFHDFAKQPFFTVVTLNDYVTTGENEIKVRIFADKYDHFKTSPNAWFRVKLTLNDAQGKVHTLSQIVYHASAKDKLSGTTHEGYYTLEAGKGFEPTALPAEVEVEKTQTTPVTFRRGEKAIGYNFIQKVIMPTPFPRWKFLDSEDIVDDEYFNYTAKEYEKLRQSPKMQALYEAYERLIELLKAKRIDEAVGMFEERFDEFSKALYRPRNELKNSLSEKFRKFTDTQKYELVTQNVKKLYFTIDENQKIAYIPGVIQFKTIGKSLYDDFSAKFRWDGNRWILTR